MVLAYGDDGTGHTVRIRHTMGTGEDRTYREGEETPEWLAQRMYMYTHPSLDERPFRALIKEHVPLSKGGSAWHVFNARVRFFKESLWTLGHRGIAIYWYAWDRKLFFPLTRLVTRWHDLRLAADVPDETERAKARDRTWVLARPCTCHDADNGFEWSLFSLWCPFQCVYVRVSGTMLPQVFKS